MRRAFKMPDDPRDLLNEINWQTLRDDMVWTVNAIEMAHLQVETGEANKRSVYPTIASVLELLCKAQIAAIKGLDLERQERDAQGR